MKPKFYIKATPGSKSENVEVPRNFIKGYFTWCGIVFIVCRRYSQERFIPCKFVAVELETGSTLPFESNRVQTVVSHSVKLLDEKGYDFISLNLKLLLKINEDVVSILEGLKECFIEVK